MLTADAGLPQPTAGSLKAYLQVIGMGTYECEAGKPYFRQMIKAPAYEVGSLFVTNKARFEALKTRSVFAMEKSPDRKSFNFEGPEYLAPSRQIAFFTGKVGRNFVASLWTESTHVKADLGGPGNEGRQRPGDRASGPGQGDETAINPAANSGGQRMSSSPGQRTGGTGQNGVRADEMARLPKADLGGTGTEARQQEGLPALRSGQGDAVAVNPPPNGGGQPIGSKPGQKTTDDGSDVIGADTMARRPLDRSAAKLRKRAAQAGTSAGRPGFSFLRGNQFFPNPNPDPDIKLDLLLEAEQTGEEMRDLDKPFGGLFSTPWGKVVNVHGGFPWGYFKMDGMEMYLINPVMGMISSCADVASTKRQFKFPVAFQLAIFGPGCTPGFGPAYATPPLFCHTPNSGCPNTRVALQAGHRAFKAEMAAKEAEQEANKPKRNLFDAGPRKGS